MKGIETIRIPVGAFEANCYIVFGKARLALVIDPGDEPRKILGSLKRHELQVAAFIATHGHMDHINALAEVAAVYHAPFAMHQADSAWAFNASNQMPPLYTVPKKPSTPFRALADGQEYDDIGEKYRIIATPGHSPGSLCLYFPDQKILFSGDTLFWRSIGRTDLPGSDEADMCRSLQKLTELPSETTVYPGHGDKTGIAAELEHNPFLSQFAP